MSHLLLLYLLFARKTRHKKPSGFLSQKPEGFVRFIGAFSSPHAIPCGGLDRRLSGSQNCRVLLFRNIISLSVAPVVLFCKPRVCGEKQILENALMIGLGSPPRMRGKDHTVAARAKQLRITPAYAGKSFQPSTFTTSLAGSPPRMRGKDGRLLGAEGILRITPAYAGKSPGLGLPDRLAAGSPPRMRGKAASRATLGQCHGITPAYAGKRTFVGFSDRQTEDHPRVCGEKLIMPAGTAWLKGSPPRMRGKAGLHYNAVFTGGITPAYAGKRIYRKTSFCRNWDHPRICGEKA